MRKLRWRSPITKFVWGKYFSVEFERGFEPAALKILTAAFVFRILLSWKYVVFKAQFWLHSFWWCYTRVCFSVCWFQSDRQLYQFSPCLLPSRAFFFSIWKRLTESNVLLIYASCSSQIWRFCLTLLEAPIRNHVYLRCCTIFATQNESKRWGTQGSCW